MPRKPEGPPPAPVVQKIRVRYTKTGRMRFSSHRDFQRMLERALRRIRVPMAYSAGFHPHPKISFAGAAPTGTASLAEFVELGLAERVEPQQFARDLSAALPQGLGISGAMEAPAEKLAEQLTGSVWLLQLPGVAQMELDAAAEAFLGHDEVVVTKMTKKGERLLDVRAAIVNFIDAPLPEEAMVSPLAEQCAILRAVVRHTTPVVRPDDVMRALATVSSLAPGGALVATRLAQGMLDEKSATVTDPVVAVTTSLAHDD